MKSNYLLLAGLVTLLTTGCTTYPKTYNYNPTINVSGNSNNQPPVLLPSPFSKKNSEKTSINYNSNSSVRYDTLVPDLPRVSYKRLRPTDMIVFADYSTEIY